MALNVPALPNPHDPDQVLHNVYAWIAGLSFSNDTPQGRGRLLIRLHSSAAALAKGAEPVGEFAFGFGDLLDAGDPRAQPPRPEVRFPTLAEFMASPEFPEFAPAFHGLATALYRAARRHPAFAGAVDV